jgi:hypothetical protein
MKGPSYLHAVLRILTAPMPFMVAVNRNAGALSAMTLPMRRTISITTYQWPQLSLIN